MVRSCSPIDHFPDRWRNLNEVKAICNSDTEPVGDEAYHTLPHLWKCMDDELNNVFIIPYKDAAGADDYACSRWEKMLGIAPMYGASLEDRQFNIYTKLIQNTPYTYEKLLTLLDELIGESETKVENDVENKTLSVKISLKSRLKADAITELLEKIVPANILLNITIVYTTYDDLSDRTYDELSAYSYNEIKITEL